MARSVLLKLSFVFAISLSLSGCFNPGPHELPDDHLDYNRSLNTALSNQLLLNIIRDQFHDPQLYVLINNVSSSYNYSAPSYGGINFGNFNHGFFKDATGGSISGPSWSVSPSFIYSPETNSKFMVESLIPLKPKALFYIIKTEGNLGDMFRMTIQRLGPYVNFAYASKLHQERNNTQSIKKFITVCEALDDIYEQNGHQLYFSKISPLPNEKNRAPHHSENIISLLIPPTVQLTSAEWRVLNSLGITHSTRRVSFSNAFSNKQKHVIRISIRSLLGLTDFLSQGVDRVPSMKYRRLDQPLLTNGLFQVHWTTSYPFHRAAIVVRYQNRWYYVRKRDVQTRKMFRLYRIINDLTQANKSSTSLLLQV